MVNEIKMAKKIGEIILEVREEIIRNHPAYKFEVYYLKDARKGCKMWDGHDSYWVIYTYGERETTELFTLGKMYRFIMGLIDNKDLTTKNIPDIKVIKNELPHEVWEIAKREAMMMGLK